MLKIFNCDIKVLQWKSEVLRSQKCSPSSDSAVFLEALVVCIWQQDWEVGKIERPDSGLSRVIVLIPPQELRSMDNFALFVA